IISNGGTIRVYFGGYGIGETVRITTDSLPDGAFNTYYDSTLEGAGGTTPYIWNTVDVSGNFDNSILDGMGLKLNDKTGVINGTMGAAAVSNTITVRLTDDSGSRAEKDFTINANSFSISTTSLPDGSVAQSYIPPPLHTRELPTALPHGATMEGFRPAWCSVPLQGRSPA
ncbi:hypothetical protein LCGC14_2838330, partial [marine sediment metagenome]